MKEAVCVDPAKAGCGEGLLWDAARGCVWWVDIAGEALHRYTPASGEARRIPLPYLISALALHRDGRLIIATAQGLGVVDTDSGHITIHLTLEESLPGNRLNDMVAAPDGSLIAGTMSEGAKAASGSLYRIHSQGVQTLMTDTTISNGLDWSPDGETLYFIDSVPGRLYARQNQQWRVLAEFDETTGRPDGLCVDATGGLWVAICDQGRVMNMTPDGDIVDSISLPCNIVTNCAFGGEDLKTLFVTTGTFSLTEDEKAANPLAGGLFAIPMTQPGKQPYALDWPTR